MRLIAQKPCTFSGEKFLTGQEIPSELVVNPKLQVKMGVISIAEDTPSEITFAAEQTGEVKFIIPVYVEEETLELHLNNEELNVFTDILQTGVNSTEDKHKISEMIQKVESEELLIVLDALDGRKHVKTEAQARAKELSELKVPSGGDE